MKGPTTPLDRLYARLIRRFGEVEISTGLIEKLPQFRAGTMWTDGDEGGIALKYVPPAGYALRQDSGSEVRARPLVITRLCYVDKKYVFHSSARMDADVVPVTTRVD